MTEMDDEALVRRVLEPDRPRLAAARAAVAGIADPREAWEVLATRGIIPMEWTHDARRGFADPPCDERAASGGDRREVVHQSGVVRVVSARDHEALYRVLETPHPPSIAGGIALACDPVGVVTAEALARDAVARLTAWSPRRPQRVLWWTIRRGVDWLPSRADDEAPTWLLDRALRSVVGSDRLYDEAYTASLPRFPLALRDDAPDDAVETPEGHYQGELWNLAITARVWSEVSASRRRTRPRRGIRAFQFAPDQPSPVAPMLALWQLGYALSAITDDAIVLVAPEIEP